MYQSLIRPLLFRCDAETIHEWSLARLAGWYSRPFLAAYHRFNTKAYPRLATQMCGIPLANPVGLAAGFDKNARAYPVLHRLGFGFAEIGTVTAHAQAGNPKPRLFRLPQDQAVINRMGFNNEGVARLATRLARQKSAIPLGGNIGKSKITPMDQAIADYETSFRALQPLVDYFVVNVSSPNTPNLRSLQEKEPLTFLLTHLQAMNRDPKRPILLKIAPDLNDFQLADIAEVAESCGIDGVIATNTTIERGALTTRAETVVAMGAGGLSGRPLTRRSTEVVAFLREKLPASIDIVGVGGVFSGQDAFEKIVAGACAVQIYTGFVYGGPATVFRILRELNHLLERAGIDKLSDAIGVAQSSRSVADLVK